MSSEIFKNPTEETVREHFKGKVAKITDAEEGQKDVTLKSEAGKEVTSTMDAFSAGFYQVGSAVEGEVETNESGRATFHVQISR